MYRKLIAMTALVGMHGAHGSETLRCGRWVVDSSATLEELLKKCGQPASVRLEESDLRAMGPNGGMIKIGTSITEYWTYDRGTGRGDIARNSRVSSSAVPDSSKQPRGGQLASGRTPNRRAQWQVIESAGNYWCARQGSNL